MSKKYMLYNCKSFFFIFFCFLFCFITFLSIFENSRGGGCSFLGDVIKFCGETFKQRSQYRLVLRSARDHFARMEGHRRKPWANCKILSLVALRQVQQSVSPRALAYWTLVLTSFSIVQLVNARGHSLFWR